MGEPKIYWAIEHDNLDKLAERLDPPYSPPASEVIEAMGAWKPAIRKNPVYKRENDYFFDGNCFGYFIGAQWLDENTAFVVRPKIKNIDFMKMFISCLSYRESALGFGKTYAISFAEPPISHKDKALLPEIDPLIMAHYIMVLERILAKGLKHALIYKEENLSSKIKGKILFSPHLKRNLAQGRGDRAYCRFAKFSPDSLENRILKRALQLCMRFFVKEKATGLEGKLSYCLGAFQNVSDVLGCHEIEKIRPNPLYKDYKEALRLAVDIIKLRRMQEGNTNQSPPFWIDMALLFEKYVYSLMLKDRGSWGEVVYQKSVAGGVLDFWLDKEKVAADTKYKKIYDEDKNKYTIEDIRQLAGYVRSYDLIKEAGKELIPCLIIYPTVEAPKFLFSLTDKINSFYEFYKLGVRLPIKEPSIDTIKKTAEG